MLNSNSEKQFGTMLVQMELIRQDQLDEALERGKETGKKLGQNLVELGYINDASILQLLAAQEAATPWMLDSDPPDFATLKILPTSVCEEHSVIPVCRRGDLLLLAMADPNDIQAMQRVRAITGLRIEPVMADADKIQSIIQHLLDPASTPLADQDRPELANLIGADNSDSDANGEVDGCGNFLTEDETAPVVGLIEQLIGEAIRTRATDIHIEPTADSVITRFRIDGCLRQIGTIPKSLQQLCIDRIKLMAGLDVKQTNGPQTGQIFVALESRVVELRVDFMRNSHGERVALRLQDQALGTLDLSGLGLAKRSTDALREIAARPSGLFLATGPSGSGITTTLYSLLNELRDDSVNIMTCEELIERDLAGVNQSQFSDSSGVSRSRQLEAILRQDPDVILVSEIRDAETAEIIVQAALDGRMVISSLQCADAVGAISRMLAFGIDPYLLSSTLIGSMSQRLVRTLCQSCKQLTADGWAAGGCDECANVGLLGLTAICEIMVVSPEISELIAKGASTREIGRLVAEQGFVTIQEDALAKVEAGFTSREEAVRVFGHLPESDTPVVEFSSRTGVERTDGAKSDVRTAAREPEADSAIDAAEIRMERVRDYQALKDQQDLEAHFHLQSHELPSYPPDEDIA